MTLKFMRLVDIFIGGLISQMIALLFVFRSRRKLPPPPRDKVKNIVVMKFFGMGSILLMTPMIRGLKSLYPDARVYLLTFSENRGLCALVDVIDEVLTFRNHNCFAFFADAFRNLLVIWKVRPEIVVDGEFFSNFTDLLSLFTFAKVRVGYHLRQVARGRSLTHQVSLNTHHHITYAFFALAAALGAKYEDADLDALSLKTPAESEFHSVSNKLKLVEGSKVIAVNPNASALSFLRRWPAEYFVSLISKMAEEYPQYTYVFVGSKSERGHVESIVGEIGSSNIVNSAGVLTISELCALLKRSELLITNDSLALHIGSAYNKAIVAFFGPETPKFYGPLSQRSLCFFENIPCSPCLLAFDNKAEIDCKDNICLKKIEPGRVLREIEAQFLRNESASFHRR